MLVVFALDHKFRPCGGRGRATLQLPIGQNGWFMGFVDPMLQLFWPLILSKSRLRVWADVWAGGAVVASPGVVRHLQAKARLASAHLRRPAPTRAQAADAAACAADALDDS